MKRLFWIIFLAGVIALCVQRALTADAGASGPSGDAAETATSDAAPASSSFIHYDDLDRAEIPASLPSFPKSYTGFRLSFNPDNHTPNWVGWELLGSEADGPVSRSNQFWQDESVSGCPTTDDYRRSGYDRGHICPAADQKWSQQAMSDCFVLANICPQDGALNRGAWQTLEKKERLWAKRDSAIVIVAGPIYETSDTKRIGATGVRVPSAFFKAICAPYLDKPRAIAFVYPNMTAPGNMQNYAMSIDDLEKLTGFDFFSTLPDDIEDMIEASASFKEWNRN